MLMSITWPSSTGVMSVPFNLIVSVDDCVRRSALRVAGIVDQASSGTNSV